MLGTAFKSDSHDNVKIFPINFVNCSRWKRRRSFEPIPIVIDEKLGPLEEASERPYVIILGAPHSVFSRSWFFANQLLVDVAGGSLVSSAAT